MWMMTGLLLGIAFTLLMAYAGAGHLPWPPNPWWLVAMFVLGVLVIGICAYLGLLVDVLVTSNVEDEDEFDAQGLL